MASVRIGKNGATMFNVAHMKITYNRGTVMLAAEQRLAYGRATQILRMPNRSKVKVIANGMIDRLFSRNYTDIRGEVGTLRRDFQHLNISGSLGNTGLIASRLTREQVNREREHSKVFKDADTVYIQGNISDLLIDIREVPCMLIIKGNVHYVECSNIINIDGSIHACM